MECGVAQRSGNHQLWFYRCEYVGGIHLCPLNSGFVPYERTEIQLNFTAQHPSHTINGEVRYFVGGAIDAQRSSATILWRKGRNAVEAQIVVGIIHHPNVGAISAFLNDIALPGNHLRKRSGAPLGSDTRNFLGISPTLATKTIPHHRRIARCPILHTHALRVVEHINMVQTRIFLRNQVVNLV